jgi:hypothetical protein
MKVRSNASAWPSEYTGGAALFSTQAGPGEAEASSWLSEQEARSANEQSKVARIRVRIDPEENESSMNGMIDPS